MSAIQIKLENGFYLERAENKNQFYYFLPNHVANIITDQTFHPLSSTGRMVTKAIGLIEEAEGFKQSLNEMMEAGGEFPITEEAI